MITTSIDNADDPLTEKILKTASSPGIRHYRMGRGHYDNNKPVEDNISSMQSKLSRLAALNEKYSISGEYQYHSGVAGEGIYFGNEKGSDISETTSPGSQTYIIYRGPGFHIRVNCYCRNQPVYIRIVLKKLKAVMIH